MAKLELRHREGDKKLAQPSLSRRAKVHFLGGYFRGAVNFASY